MDARNPRRPAGVAHCRRGISTSRAVTTEFACACGSPTCAGPGSGHPAGTSGSSRIRRPGRPRRNRAAKCSGMDGRGSGAVRRAGKRARDEHQIRADPRARPGGLREDQDFGSAYRRLAEHAASPERFAEHWRSWRADSNPECAKSCRWRVLRRASWNGRRGRCSMPRAASWAAWKFSAIDRAASFSIEAAADGKARGARTDVSGIAHELSNPLRASWLRAAAAGARGSRGTDGRSAANIPGGGARQHHPAPNCC